MPTATATDKEILDFITSIHASAYTDTADILIGDYIRDDSTCEQLQKLGLRRYQIIDTNGEVVSGARERYTYENGAVIETPPFFTAALALVHATVNKLKAGPASHADYAADGTIKSGGFRFLPSQEQIDEQIAKKYARFMAWLGTIRPSVAQIGAFYSAYSSGLELKTTPSGRCYFLSTSDMGEILPLAGPAMQELKDPLGEVLAIWYSYQLPAA